MMLRKILFASGVLLLFSGSACSLFYTQKPASSLSQDVSPLLLSAKSSSGEKELKELPQSLEKKETSEVPSEDENSVFDVEACYRKERFSWLLGMTLDSFMNSSSVKSAWAKDASEFLHKALEEYCGVPGASSRNELMLEVGNLISRSCSDPLVNLFYARYLLDEKQTVKALPVILAVSSEMQANAYPGILLATASDTLFRALSEAPDNEKNKLLRQVSLNVCILSLLAFRDSGTTWFPPFPTDAMGESFVYRESQTLWSMKNGYFYSDALKKILDRELEEKEGAFNWLRSMYACELAYANLVELQRKPDVPEGKLTESGMAVLESLMSLQRNAGDKNFFASPYPDTLKLKTLALLEVQSPEEAESAFRNAVRTGNSYFPLYAAYSDYWMRTDSTGSKLMNFAEEIFADSKVPKRVFIDCLMKMARLGTTSSWDSVFRQVGMDRKIDAVYASLFPQAFGNDRNVLILEKVLLLFWAGKYDDAKKSFNIIPGAMRLYDRTFPDMDVPWKPLPGEFESVFRVLTGPDSAPYRQWLTDPAPEAKMMLFESIYPTTSNDTNLRNFLRHTQARFMLNLPFSMLESGDFGNPMILAFRSGKEDIVRFLLKHGELQDRNLRQNESLLDEALKHDISDELFLLLLTSGIRIPSKLSDGVTPLNYALLKGKKKSALQLVELNASLNEADEKTLRTPLHLAILSGDIPCVKALLRRRVKNNQPDRDGNTPLHLAVENASKEIVNLLLNSVIMDYPKNRASESPLDIAQRKNDYELVELLATNKHLPGKR